MPTTPYSPPKRNPGSVKVSYVMFGSSKGTVTQIDTRRFENSEHENAISAGNFTLSKKPSLIEFIFCDGLPPDALGPVLAAAYLRGRYTGDVSQIRGKDGELGCPVVPRAAPNAPTTITFLVQRDGSYLVDGQRIARLDDAISFVVTRRPTEVALPNCRLTMQQRYNIITLLANKGFIAKYVFVPTAEEQCPVGARWKED